ncbi:hypothetical protein P7C73_g5072, partial [Tremellales sp. Uapishka_1]
MSITNRAAKAADQVAHPASQLMQGKIPGDNADDKALGHPIHPSTVHWPIAFLTASFGLTTLSLLPPSFMPTFILPPPATLPALAHYSAGAGVLFAMPSIATGLGEAYEMTREQLKAKGNWGTVLSDAWEMKDNAGRKLKMTVKHASMNDMVVGLAGWNWYLGHKYPTAPLPKVNVWLSAIALPVLLYAAMLGGKLVYEYAMGVQRQGSGKEVKKSQ